MHKILPFFIASSFVCASIGCGPSSPNAGGLNRTVVVDPPPPGTIPDSLTVIPGPEYEAGWLHKVFFGEHYRALWTTPTKVKVLDLATFAGGLTPIKTGGGFQTKSLRFKAGNGGEYSFRSVNKDPSKILPPDLQDTFAAGVVQDQISSSHPVAALVVDPLADALGIIHPRPTLCILPDDERLGEFREGFAGILGIIEDYPSDGPDGTAGFAGSQKIVSTVKLFEALEKNSEDRVNASTFLTARLLDILIGDWDRHIDQWRWARYEEEGRDVWYPIPRDRDQAFSRFDGFFPYISKMAVTQLEHFNEDIDDIWDITFSGRFVDRRLLVSLDKTAWDNATASFLTKVTDDAIENAVKHLPLPYYERNGEWLAAMLKSRLRQLKNASDEFYQLLASYVDVHLSDKAEYVSVKRLDDERVEVTAYRKEKETDEPKGSPVYHRVFLASETKEIRLYLHGGDDKAIVSGEVGSSITVRIVGGGGDDELIDESRVRSSFLGIFPGSKTQTYFYDDSGDNTFAVGPSGSVDKSSYKPPPFGTKQY